MSSDGVRNRIVVISGPSGVGKSTITRQVVEQMDEVHLSVSATTREKSESEVEGKDYWFISRDEFEKRIEQGRFLEYAKVFDNYYGTPVEELEKTREDGDVLLLEIDVQGGKKVKDKYPETVMIFILAPSEKDLAKRLNNRGRDAEHDVEKRLNGASNEIAAAWQYYDHMVINDELSQAVDEVKNIIKDNTGDK